MGNRLNVLNGLIFFVLVCFMCDCADSNLTTAVVKQNTSPKPSTIYRRINVDRNTDIQSNSPVQFFQMVDTRRRNTETRSQIWDWDNWCLLQPRKGNCDQNINRFYYNRQLEECSQFVYSGCDANENNFQTKLECERRCSGVNPILNSDGIDSPLRCLYQPDMGGCLAYDTKYFYDINRRTCSKIVYGGCAGNSNRFDTMFDCMKTCGGFNK